MSFNIITFGCRLNTYESEVIRENLKEFFGEEYKDDVIIFNSCAVTGEAERQLRQSIRKAKRENLEAKIVVAGCAAQANPEKYADMEEVDLVLGNEEKMYISKYIQEMEKIKTGVADKIPAPIFLTKTEDLKQNSLHLIEGIEGRCRAFVQIQTGCNHFCTYCIIPYTRGRHKSFKPEEIIKQIKILVDRGYNEVVITGVDITDYGTDFKGEEKATLADLIKQILQEVPELPRLRISSIDVAEIDDDFIELITTENRIMPHIHISLQSGDDLILKRMKRRHKRQQVIDFCNKVREKRPDVAFGADIITGFPTEEEENFQNSLKIIKEAGIVFGHIFPYSEREGTPAAKMPQVPKSVRKERAKRLREAASKQLNNFLHGMIGNEEIIILEKIDYGRTENFCGVKLEDDSIQKEELIGKLLKVKITNSKENILIGKIAY